MPDPAGHSHAVVLGSGFSRAISPLMPTLSELRDIVLDDLGIRIEELKPFSGNLEQWMSFIAVDQPWLTDADNLSNRSLFERVRSSLAQSIFSAENRAIAEPTPDWLLRLVWTWCENEAAVFTFNYDTLVERCLVSMGRVQTLADVYAVPLMERVAAGDGTMLGAEEPNGPVLQLYKLHGSVNWAFGGLQAPPNDRIVLTEAILPWKSRADPIAKRSLRYQSRFADLTQLIIPPTFAKGPYYNNLSLRAQWTRAATSLRESTNLTVIGYSFPPGDQVAGQWVSSSFMGWRMDVVDAAAGRPQEIRDRLPEARTGLDFTGTRALEDYVDHECGPLVRWNISALDPSGTVTVELWVNGVDVLVALPDSQRPWRDDYQAAQAWVHDRVQAAAPNFSFADRAVGGMSRSFDTRYVVLPKGATLSLN